MSSSVKTPRAAFGKLLLNETRLAKRVPVGIATGLGIPLLLLVIFGLIPATTKVTGKLGGQSYFSLTFPVLLSLVVVTIGTMILPRALVSYRESGILRRLSTTPVPPSWLLAAQLIVNLVLAVIGVVLLLVVGVRCFGLHAPQNWLGFVLGLLLTMSALFAIGLWVTAIAPSSGVAQGIGGLLFYAMLFFGGIWIPRPIMSHVLLTIGNWTPVGPSVDALQRAMQGAFPTAQSLLCLAGYTAVFGYLAVRYFKWE